MSMHTIILENYVIESRDHSGLSVINIDKQALAATLESWWN